MADDDEDDEAWVDEAWMDEVVESPSSRGANRPAETGIFDLDADDASLANQLSKRINYHSKALNLAALQAAQERRARGASPLLVEPPKVKDADANADANNASSNLPDLLHEQRWTLRRSFCLNRLAQLYGRMPLVTTNCSFGVMSNH